MVCIHISLKAENNYTSITVAVHKEAWKAWRNLTSESSPLIFSIAWKYSNVAWLPALARSAYQVMTSTVLAEQDRLATSATLEDFQTAARSACPSHSVVYPWRWSASSESRSRLTSDLSMNLECCQLGCRVGCQVYSQRCQRGLHVLELWMRSYTPIQWALHRQQKCKVSRQPYL